MSDPVNLKLVLPFAIFLLRTALFTEPPPLASPPKPFEPTVHFCISSGDLHIVVHLVGVKLVLTFK